MPKHRLTSPEKTPSPAPAAKRVRIPTEKVRAADAEKVHTKAKKSIPSKSANKTVISTEPLAEKDKLPPSNEDEGTTASKPDRRTRVEDVDDNGDDWEDVYEVDEDGRRVKAAPEPKKETADEELSRSSVVMYTAYSRTHVDRVSKTWTSVVYAFYKPDVAIVEDNEGHRAHVFRCVNRGCKHQVKRWLHRGDQYSTGNLRKHVKSCFGEEALQRATDSGSVGKAREGVKTYLRSGDLTTSFKRCGKGSVTYSVRQHTATETRYVSIQYSDQRIHMGRTAQRLYAGSLRASVPLQSWRIARSRS